MAHIFEITASPEKTVLLNTDGTGEVAFTVTNVTGTAVKGRAVLAPEKSPALQWLKLVGEPERLIQPKLSDTFVVKVGVPPGTKPGDYSFRLDAISVSRPDEDSTQGPTIGVPVALTVPPPKSFPWWILVVVAVVIGVLSYAALKLIPGNDVAVPRLTTLKLADGEARLTASKLRLGTVTKQLSNQSNAGVILLQTPASSEKLPPGSAVNVTVGAAPGPVAIANPGFENANLDQAGDAGRYSQIVANSVHAPSGGTLSSWTVAVSGPATGPAAAAGAFLPDLASPYNWTKKWWSGGNVGYLGAFAGQSVSLFQTLSAEVEPNSTYTLSALIGNRKFSPFADYTLELIAGATTIASTRNEVALADDSSGLASTKYTSGSTNLPVGPLQIRITTRAMDGSTHGTPTETFVDDISLEVVANVDSPRPVSH